MRTYIRALVTLDAVFSIPFRYVNRNAALLVSSRAAGECAVFSAGKCGYRQLVAFLCVHRLYNVLYEFCCLSYSLFCSINSISPCSRDFNLHCTVHTTVNSGIVHVQDGVALLAVGLCDSCFHIFHSLLNRDDVRQLEERSLQYGVDSVAKTDFFRNFRTIDDVEIDFLCCQLFFQLRGQVLVQLVNRPCCVQQECAALVQLCYHVIQMYILLLVACNKVCCLNQICRTDRLVTKTQVALCDTAGLFGVIAEVSLRVHICVVTDNLDGVLVRANRTVCAQTPEFAADCAVIACNVYFLANRKGCICYVVHDTDRKVVFRLIQRQVRIYRKELRGCNVFGTKAIAAANNNRSLICLKHSCADVHVQRFALCAGLFCSVQNSNLLHCLRQYLKQLCSNERTEQMNLYQANLFAFCCQEVNRFFDCFTRGTHCNDNSVSIGCAVVVEQLVISACDSADFLHVFFHNCGQSFIILVRCLTRLEIDVRILCGTSDNGMLGVQCVSLETVYRVHVDNLSQFFVIHYFDFLDFVRCAETIEEMQEGYAALDCGKMRNARQVHNFLYGVGSQKSEARLTACHNVGMVAEDGQCLCSQRTRRYMEYAGKQFAGNFIHIGNHQQKTLRCCICCCQRTSSQGTMYCTGRTCFGLHFYNFYSLSEKVLFAIRCPIVCFLSHWGRRCDGENASYFSKRIGSVCSSLITVHRFHYFRHSSSSLKKNKSGRVT